MIGWPVGRREKARCRAKVQIGAELLCKSVTHVVRERDRGHVGTWARGRLQIRGLVDQRLGGSEPKKS